MIGESKATVRDVYMRVRRELEDGGVENPRFEAEQLLRGVGIDKALLITDGNVLVTDGVSAELCGMTARRLSGEPLQYILGEWEFYGLPFKVGKGVLIPRQDTETLVEVCVEFLKKRADNERKTLDLCAGSGCIGIALAKETRAEVTAVEKSQRAFRYLRENIALNGVAVNAVSGDILEERTVGGEFDLIVSNPPYLDDQDMSALQREVAHEPREALYGGADGLYFYRAILGLYPKRLRRGGMLAVEIGAGQEDAVCGMFLENGIQPRVRRDLCGVNRVVYGVK